MMARSKELLRAIQERVLVWDGAMGTQIQAAGLEDKDFTLSGDEALSTLGSAAAHRLSGQLLEGCNEILNLTRPDVIQQIHGSYLSAGATLIETNTFGAGHIVLNEYDAADLLDDITRAAARNALKAVEQCDHDAWVIGAIGPGTRLLSLRQTEWDDLEVSAYVAAKALLEEGVHALLLETMQDPLMLKASLVGFEKAIGDTHVEVPVFVQITVEQTGTMLVGTELLAALNMLEAFPRVAAIGMNCATGPEEMRPHLQSLAQHSTRPITVQPNAGLPVMEKGEAVYKLTPQGLADYHVQFVEQYGVTLCGGCCGTGPEHTQAVAKAVADTEPNPDVQWRQQASSARLVGCSSLYQFVPYRQDNSSLLVGEKTNANGSRAFKKMLAAENWQGLVELAQQLEGEGSHVLDVCTAYVGRDEVKDMTTLLHRLNTSVTAPIMIDSTEPPVVEAALKCLGGKPLVNSIHFEDGGERLEEVLGLCRTYGAAVVALTIDEDGMAKTAERKVAIAERILERTRAYGMADHDVFFDCLTFTLGSGDEEFRTSAMATIEAIRQLTQRYPEVNTILGVSNVSFGLKPAARHVVNSVFLREAEEAGLSSAIVHVSKILPESRVEADVWKIAEDLIYDRRKFKEETA